jgi:hypothetical protein
MNSTHRRGKMVYTTMRSQERINLTRRTLEMRIREKKTNIIKGRN